MPRTCRHTFRLGAVLIAAGLQAGCSSLPSIPWFSDDDAPSTGGKQIQIRSNPAGAEVLANDRPIGITPVTVTPSNIWNTGFRTATDYGMNYQYVGTLTIRMPGCKDFKTEVDDYLLHKDVAVQLECGADYRPLAAPAVPQPQTTPAGGVAAPAGSYAPADFETSEEIMARRLRRLEGLLNRGLITEDEYQQVRRRILGEL